VDEKIAGDKFLRHKWLELCANRGKRSSLTQSLQRCLWADKKLIGDGTALLGRMNHKPVMEINVMGLFIKPGRSFGFMYQDERISDGHLVVEDGIWIN
jgi:hypothetical protein